VQISDEDFAKYVFEISKIPQDNQIDLTDFEILTAVVFKYFYDNEAEVVVLETGLGGRFDATNVIKKNLCSVITHVDFDHTERLGDTLDKIAYEKAGIIKKGCPCIVFEGKEVYYDVADSLDAPLQLILPMVNSENLALKGVHQQENLALALAVIENCFPKISDDVIQVALGKVKHICRFQYIEDKNLIIDGAHNPNGVNALRQSLDMYYPYGKRRFIFGCLNNKDYEVMVNSLFDRGDEIYFYHYKHQNSCTVKQLQEVCSFEAKALTDDVEIDFGDGVLTIICGSFYMIEELVKRFSIEL
jgi:dihydrofolate synthase/folylpolyglutamate synthase